MTQTEYEGRRYIDGEFRDARSGRRYEVINPADESVVGVAADATAEDVSDAADSVRRGHGEAQARSHPGQTWTRRR